MLTIKEKRSRNSRRYITKLGSDQHPDSNSAGSIGTQPIWRPSGEKVPGSMLQSCVRLQRLQVWVSPYNPRTLIDIISNLWANSSSGCMLILFVCLTKLIMLLSLQLSRPGHLQGLKNLKSCPRSISGAASFALTAGSQGTHSQGSVQPG